MEQFIIPAQSGMGFEVPKGHRITVIDAEDGQVADFFAVMKNAKEEYISPAVTIDCNESLCIEVGTILYSNQYHPMFRVERDDVGKHDLLFPSCSKAKKRVVQVQRSDIKRFYNGLVDQKVLKISTVDNIHNVLHQVLQVAVDDNYIRQNPTDRMLKELRIAHGHEIEKRKALTLAQQELFFNYMKNTPRYRHWYPVFYIMANTGMRVGELTGLRWQDVDMENGMISVNHTLVYYNHRDEVGTYFSINTPKTEAGCREIPMVAGVKEAFEMVREYQKDAGIESKVRIDGYEDFIFVNKDGNMQHHGTLNKAIKRICRDCNDQVLLEQGFENNPVLLPNFSCHILRHTFATRLCESGINIKVIQDVLGHVDVSTTMDIYVDVMNETKKREIANFDGYMAGVRT